VAAFVVTSKSIQLATAWTGGGTEPGGIVAPASIAGTLTSAKNLSPFVHSGAEPGSSVAMQPSTTFASQGFEQKIPGLKSGDDLVLQCYGDYAATLLDVIIKTDLGGLGAFVYGDIKPTSAARGATNPSFVFGAYISGDKKLTGAVGDVAGREITLSITGTFTELIA
jgi:hypothetical protein